MDIWIWNFSFENFRKWLNNYTYDLWSKYLNLVFKGYEVSRDFWNVDRSSFGHLPSQSFSSRLHLTNIVMRDMLNAVHEIGHCWVFRYPLIHCFIKTFERVVGSIDHNITTLLCLFQWSICLDKMKNVPRCYQESTFVSVVGGQPHPDLFEICPEFIEYRFPFPFIHVRSYVPDSFCHQCWIDHC